MWALDFYLRCVVCLGFLRAADLCLDVWVFAFGQGFYGWNYYLVALAWVLVKVGSLFGVWGLQLGQGLLGWFS
jgi:hypothetical protein